MVGLFGLWKRKRIDNFIHFKHLNFLFLAIILFCVNANWFKNREMGQIIILGDPLPSIIGLSIFYNL
jgi:hypothetical protein